MICTWLNEQEFEKYKQVSDKDVNDLLRDIRAIDDRFYINEVKVSMNRLFRKPVVKSYYTLYICLGGMDVQAINFCQEHTWSINTSVSKSYMVTYLLGVLHGINIEMNKKQ